MGEGSRGNCGCEIRRFNAEEVGRDGAEQNEEGRRAGLDAHGQVCCLASPEQRPLGAAVALEERPSGEIE